jgi:hypothetical protein
MLLKSVQSEIPTLRMLKGVRLDHNDAITQQLFEVNFETVLSSYTTLSLAHN